MKKIISILVVTVMLAAAFVVPASCENGVNVTVTIWDGNGNAAVSLEPIFVTDADSDGKLTIADALTVAHDKWYDGGAAAGFATASTEWGLSVSKLWGVENGGSYGYYVNNTMAMGLADELKEGDYLAAFVYVDAKGLSDAYAYIELAQKQPETVGRFALEAKYLGFDENWNTVTMPLAGASVYVGDKKTDVVTDENGAFELSFTENGAYTVTVKSAEKNYACGVYALEADCFPNIKVTICDGSGNAVLVYEEMSFGDADGDGKFTIADALTVAHDKWYDGGAAAGFATASTEWGLSVSKLWGVENGGSYGYYVNNAMAMGLADELKDGDYLAAFVYVDAKGLSDVYAYIEPALDVVVPAMVGVVALRANFIGWDENWAPVVMPVVGADVYVNGEKTEFVTGEDGSFVLTLTENGEYTVTVKSAERNYACAVTKISIESIPAAFGDVNGDGALNAKDVTMIMKFLVGAKNDKFLEYAADFNGDGAVNAKDVTSLMKKLVAA